MAVIILKATEKCNSNCYYCDVVTKKDSGKSMSFEVLEETFIRINEYLLEHPAEMISLLWHGGEPLLLGPDYYLKAHEFEKVHCPETAHRIVHAMQTNLISLTEEMIGILKKLGIKNLGTSYDPEPHIRGAGITQRDSENYNRRFMHATKILEKHNIGWGLIYVVTQRSLRDPLAVFYFLSNLVLSGGFNINPVLIYDEARKDIAITPEQYVEFLGTIFPIWWQHRQRYPAVEPFKSLVDNIINGHKSLGCVDSGACTYVHINVAPDGETSQCGRSSDWGLLNYGNITDHSLTNILADRQRDELEKRVRMLPETECKDCRFWNLCHGGCPLDAWSRHKSFMHKSEWCYAKHCFIEQYFEPITGVTYAPS